MLDVLFRQLFCHERAQGRRFDTVIISRHDLQQGFSYRVELPFEHGHLLFRVGRAAADLWLRLLRFAAPGQQWEDYRERDRHDDCRDQS